ncbi:GH3 family domain-containing protein [Kitasatospora kifunensis]|uniref:GH3 auxin-responsive promoter n=1 Tax=Kitasatospora kifunensis TaxID=58351 RepID=A0A7W7R955_KITKI|nr:GH3 auxin-responsive promoter family protein [Kitasatospora kifunensis]MBB4927708.1 hypothetical protein [Kitasatospora kifunensis]
MTTEAWQEYWRARRNTFGEECRVARAELLADLRRPERAQQRVLADLVDLSRNSLHWQEQGYGPAANPDAFRRQLPIRRYEDYLPLIEREIHAKGGILACSPVPRWLKTSGTTGTPKRIPYSVHWMEHYRTPALQALWGTYLAHCPELLAHPYATLDTQTTREEPAEFLQGAQYQGVTSRHPLVNSRDWQPPWQQAPWFDLEAPSAHEGRMYHRIRHLLGRRPHFVSAINPSTLISLRDLVAANGERLVRDLCEGTLEGKPWGRPDEAAAHRLAAALRQADFALTDLWPTLTGYTCWTSASTRLYQGKLDAIFPGVAQLAFMSCGSEGVTAIPVDDTLHSQPLAVNQGFFEFVPAEVPLGERLAAGVQVDTVLFDQVEAGREYHLLMSQANGLHRLWIGDIYHVDRVVDGVPWVHLVRRDGVFHSFTGEKVTEVQVTEALERGFAGLGLDMGLYMCGPRWAEPPGYVALVESRAGGRGVDGELSARVDRQLRTINTEYESKRGSGRLDPIEVITVAPDAISSYVERRRTAGNATQYKYKPFQPDIDFVSAIVGG